MHSRAFLALFVSMVSLYSAFLEAGESRVAAFNIQVFGRSKASKPEVMSVIRDIILRYDLTLVQEIRDSSNQSVKDLMDLLNSQGSKYQLDLSPALGRTRSTEKYAYIYNPQKFALVSSWVGADKYDVYEREPYFAVWEELDSGLRFMTVGIHLKPDDVESELEALRKSTLYYSQQMAVDAVLVMGDLNADCRYFTPEDDFSLDFYSSYDSHIHNWEDTTVSKTDCAYDRLLSSPQLTQYTHNAGVFRFDSYYGLSYDFAKSVSDHYPVELNLSIP